RYVPQAIGEFHEFVPRCPRGVCPACWQSGNLVLDPSFSGCGPARDFAIIQPKRLRTIASSD
ncbi:MAG TPA: hypothetical protein VE325_08985, partial [Burkholderiales bacterium]|nr:hypothetical protein [Burkholderiales bacterium]